MLICALAGVDGSGKSTFARKLEQAVRGLRSETRVVCLWLRYLPRAVKANAPSSTITASYRGHPLKHVARVLSIPGVWVDANAWIYKQQLARQLEAARQYEVVIADRYVLDFVVDLAAYGMISRNKCQSVMERLPTATLGYHIDVDDSTLRVRIKSGDSWNRACERAALYREYAPLLGYYSLDCSNGRAEKSVCEVAEKIVEALR